MVGLKGAPTPWPTQMVWRCSMNAWGRGTCSFQRSACRILSSRAANSSALARPWCTFSSSERGGSLRSANLAAMRRQVDAIIWMRRLSVVSPLVPTTCTSRGRAVERQVSGVWGGCPRGVTSGTARARVGGRGATHGSDVAIKVVACQRARLHAQLKVLRKLCRVMQKGVHQACLGQ